MKRLVIALLLIAPRLLANHAFVACSGTCTNSNTVTSSLTLPASGTLTFTAHNFLWVGIRGGHGATINTPTSSPSETWTCTSTVDPGVGLSTITGCYANNIAGGSYTITVTTSSNTNLHIAVDEYSGTPTTCSPVGTSTTGTAASATNVTAGSITTTGTSSILGATGIGGNASSWNTVTGTQRASLNSGRIGTNDRLNLGAGTSSIRQDFSGSSTDMAIVSINLLITCPAAATNGIPTVLTFSPNLRWFFYWMLR